MSANRRATLLFFIAAGVFSLVFLAIEIRRGNRTSLWIDEIFALRNNVRAQSYADLIVRGATPQGSPSPLPYLLDKILDDSRRFTGYFGLSPQGYSRLWAPLFTTILGLAAVLWVAGRLDPQPPALHATRLFLAGCALATFYLNPKIFHFAAESRPYALWNSLWFLALARMLLSESSPWPLTGILTLLALSATASCYQILATAAALFVILRRRDGRTAIEAVRKILKITALPALASLAYLLRTRTWHYWGPEWGTWPGFFKLWLWSHFYTWIASFAALAAALKPALRRFVLAPATMTILLLLGPLIYGMTRLRGFFFADRQYLYYGLAIPVLLLLIALGWPHWEDPRRRWVRPAGILLGLALVASHAAATVWTARPPARSVRLVLLDPSSPLRRLLAMERPASISHPPDLDPVLSWNLELIAEWIPARFRSVPAGSRELRVRKIGEDLVVESIGTEPTPDGWIRIAISP